MPITAKHKALINDSASYSYQFCYENESYSSNSTRNELYAIGSNPGYRYFGARYYDADLSLWLSVDPLASKYPSMSPYMYCAGNPVMLVDPDGREIIKSKTKYKTMKDGSERQLKWLSFRKADRIEVNITVKNMKIIDLTGRISAGDMAKEAKDIQGEITNYWSTDGHIKNKRGQKLKVTTTFENDISVETDRSSIKHSDHVIAIVNTSTINKYASGAGMTLLGGKGSNIMLTQKSELGAGDGAYAHEFGHMLGLDDVRIYRDGMENTHIMYNWAPSFRRSRAPSRSMKSVQSTPCYSEFKRSSFGSPSYRNLPKSLK